MFLTLEVYSLSLKIASFKYQLRISSQYFHVNTLNVLCFLFLYRKILHKKCQKYLKQKNTIFIAIQVIFKRFQAITSDVK